MVDRDDAGLLMPFDYLMKIFTFWKLEEHGSKVSFIPANHVSGDNTSALQQRTQKTALSSGFHI
jgi:hypothetical protein